MFMRVGFMIVHKLMTRAQKQQCKDKQVQKVEPERCLCILSSAYQHFRWFQYVKKNNYLFRSEGTTSQLAICFILYFIIRNQVPGLDHPYQILPRTFR